MRFVGAAHWVVGVLFLMGVSGCAPLPMDTGDQGALVKKMAEARWRALIGGRVDEAYDYLSPGTKAILTVEQYKGRMKLGSWKTAKALSADCDEARCKVLMEIVYASRNRISRQDVQTVLEEAWIKESDKWWYVPRL